MVDQYNQCLFNRFHVSVSFIRIEQIRRNRNSDTAVRSQDVLNPAEIFDVREKNNPELLGI